MHRRITDLFSYSPHNSTNLPKEKKIGKGSVYAYNESAKFVGFEDKIEQAPSSKHWVDPEYLYDQYIHEGTGMIDLRKLEPSDDIKDHVLLVGAGDRVKRLTGLIFHSIQECNNLFADLCVFFLSTLSLFRNKMLHRLYTATTHRVVIKLLLSSQTTIPSRGGILLVKLEISNLYLEIQGP